MLKEAALIEMDTSKKADAKRMAGEAVEAFGTIDGIVCGAIYSSREGSRACPRRGLGQGHGHRLRDYFLCAQAAGRVMLEKGSGSIAFVSFHRRNQTYPLAGASSMCKAGAIMLSRLFGVEWADRGGPSGGRPDGARRKTRGDRRGLRLSLVGPGPIHYVGQPARGRRSSGKQDDPHTG